MMGGGSSPRCAAEPPHPLPPRQPASTAPQQQQRPPASLSPEELTELMTLQMLFMQGGASWPDEASRVRHDALNARCAAGAAAAPTPVAPTRVAR